MAAFRAAERDESAAQFGKEHADAAVDRMKARLDKLKTIQVSDYYYVKDLHQLRAFPVAVERKLPHQTSDGESCRAR